MCFRAYFLKLQEGSEKSDPSEFSALTASRLIHRMLLGKSLEYVVHTSRASWMSFLVFKNAPGSSKFVFLLIKHFIMYFLCLLLFLFQLIMYCTVSWTWTIHYLSSVAMHLYGWVGGEFFAEGAQWLDFWLSTPVSFFYNNFLYIFPVPRQAVPADIPSLLHQYSDSSEKTVYLKLERAVQHRLLILLLKSV